MPLCTGFLRPFKREVGRRTGLVGLFHLGKKPTMPHAEISDASCLQRDAIRSRISGETWSIRCRFLPWKTSGRVETGMKLRCASCHAQIVQGQHLTVHETNCFICHYYKAGPKGEEECLSCAVGGCTSCHFEPKGDINVKGWSFNHGDILREGWRVRSATSM